MNKRMLGAGVVAMLVLSGCGGGAGDDASEGPSDAAGAQSEQAAAGAGEVQVVAKKEGKKYVFDFQKSVPAGKTTFVMSNKDDEPHFMALAELKKAGVLGKALALEAQGKSKAAQKFLVNDEVGGSKPAKPGKKAEAKVDLKPGAYAMLCFIPGPDGKPHAFNGMAVEFEVK